MADTLDVLTSNEAIGALAGTGTPDSAKLAMLTTAVSRTLDKICGPIVVRAMPTRTLYSPTGAIWLDAPAASTTFAFTAVTITEYVGATGTVLTAENVAAATANDYLLISPPSRHAGRLVRRSARYEVDWSGQQVTVAYSAGRYANTAAVGPEFKQAAKIILAHEWSLEQGFGGLNEELVPVGAGFLVPRRVRDELLMDEVLLSSGLA